MEVDLGQRLPGRIELLYYRLAQEALSNVRKHAEAKNVRLSLKVEDNRLFMTVVDDGKGFDVDTVLQRNEAGHHLGLRSMMQRIRDAQGALTISPAEPNGTILRFQCPLPGGGAANQER